MLRAQCVDCDWIGEPRTREHDVRLDLRSHLRRRERTPQGSGRAPRCAAIVADEKRTAARIKRAEASGLEAEFPSLKWGVDEWMLAFDMQHGMADAILNGIAHATTRWREGCQAALSPAEISRQQDVDRLMGIH